MLFAQTIRPTHLPLKTRHRLVTRIASESPLSKPPNQTLPTIFSGIQPTGELHIGNYLGALANWKKIQDNASIPILCVVDMHALTTPDSPACSKLSAKTLDTAAALLACGVNPDKTILYNQSQVQGHAQLAWILLCLTRMSDLKSMTQYKEKANTSNRALAGLFSYPVLMAADILLYKATHVPVGEDQLQHLELVRTLASKFNRTFGVPFNQPDFFPRPQTIHTPSKRIMSLRDVTKKMSKSDPSPLSRINLSDSVDDISLKIQRAKTDSLGGLEYDPSRRPELANLLRIYSAFSLEPIDTIVQRHAHHHTLAFKQSLTDVIVSTIDPISKKIHSLRSEETYLQQILLHGAERANKIASKTLKQVHQLIGCL